jgi:predicted metalloprotease with PDZ domain
MVVAGAPPSFDGAKLLADTQLICETEIEFWHGKSSKKDSKVRKAGKGKSPIPFKNYVFLLNTTHDGYGGLEHRNSTALLASRKDLPVLAGTAFNEELGKQPSGYTTLLGLISHEYFHTWNVKRLRPAEFASYDYSQENYTELLWFFEGFTSYFDELFLRRAKLIDDATYLKLLTKSINQVQQTPGRLVQTVAQSSFDAWVKYYRQDENTPNATVNYYTKGSLVALCFDLTLRSDGKTSLDAVMRELWRHSKGGPMTEQDFLQVLQKLSGRSFEKELKQWVHGTGELPVAALLKVHGVEVGTEKPTIAQQLGMRIKEEAGIRIQQVLRDSAGEQAGFAAGDEWLAVNAGGGTHAGPWRLQTLSDLQQYCGKARKVQALVSRDKRILTLTLTLPKPTHLIALTVQNADVLSRWLDAR